MSYYFDKITDVSSKPSIIKVELKGNFYTFKTDNNVFSKKGLDFGTRTLLETIDMSNISGQVLDIGCGYGPIGIIIKSNTLADVDMIDINERALMLAKFNANINKVDVNIFESNIYSKITKKYNYIISNPPIRVGKEILYKILKDAKDYLNDLGHLIFVINKDQGAKSTIKYLQEFYDIKILGKNKGFYVIDCQKH